MCELQISELERTLKMHQSKHAFVWVNYYDSETI